MFDFVVSHPTSYGSTETNDISQSVTLAQHQDAISDYTVCSRSPTITIIRGVNES